MQSTSEAAFQSKELIWLREGIKLMAGGGLVNFNVDELSNIVGKAETSFYFFFKSREEFLLRLAQFWEFKYTDDYICKTEQIEDPLARLEKLIDLIYPKMADELIWVHFKEKALTNLEIKMIVDRVESKRVDVFCAILQELNYPVDVAKEKARMFIYLFFGWSVLHPKESDHSDVIEHFKKMSFQLLLDKEV